MLRLHIQTGFDPEWDSLQSPSTLKHWYIIQPQTHGHLLAGITPEQNSIRVLNDILGYLIELLVYTPPFSLMFIY